MASVDRLTAAPPPTGGSSKAPRPRHMPTPTRKQGNPRAAWTGMPPIRVRIGAGARGVLITLHTHRPDPRQDLVAVTSQAPRAETASVWPLPRTSETRFASHPDHRWLCRADAAALHGCNAAQPGRRVVATSFVGDALILAEKALLLRKTNGTSIRGELRCSRTRMAKRKRRSMVNGIEARRRAPPGWRACRAPGATRP